LDRRQVVPKAQRTLQDIEPTHNACQDNLVLALLASLLYAEGRPLFHSFHVGGSFLDSRRFDALVQRLAVRSSRRTALHAGAALAATGLLTAGNAGAETATPVATPGFPADPHPSADSAMTHPEYLFVQPFDAGTWEPKSGEDGTYLLTLTGVAADTTYFSDRPERITGLAPTQPFLDGLGFTSENPPNAAIVAQTESGEQDVLVVQLFNPVYDAGAATLVYEARILADYGGRGLAHLAQQQTDYELAASFEDGSLFIDDCPNGTDMCWDGCIQVGTVVGGNCWSWNTWTCNPCGSYASVCDSTYYGCEYDANGIQVSCEDDIFLCGSYGCCAAQNCQGC
jgi:hypothetical protein